MKIIAIANQKGGVGKTTTAINLSAALAEAGHPTLLIDLDPQANTTSGLGFEQEPGRSLYPALIGQVSVTQQIRETGQPNLSIITSEMDLAGSEVEIARLDNPQMQLRKTLQPLRDENRFHYVIMDCPPSLGILMTSALVAADGILVPVQCEFFALEGVGKILGLMERIKAINPALDLCGVLMTMYDTRTKLSQQVMTELQTHLPEKVFKAIVPRSIRLGEAPSFGRSILSYDASGIGALCYRQVAEEFVQRVPV